MANFTITDTYGGASYGSLSNIMDGSTSTYWTSSDVTVGEGQYVLITSDTPISLSRVAVTVPTALGDNHVLQTSLDGVNYTDQGTFSSYSTTQSFYTSGTWQYIRIYCTNGNWNRISISEVALTYTDIAVDKYNVNVQVGDGATVDKLGTTEVNENTSFELTINGTLQSITDNNIDVMGSVVSHSSGSTSDTITGNPTAYTTSGSISGTRYRNAIGKGSGATASGNDYSGSSSSTATITYSFDFSSIPSNATIQSVTVKVGGHAETATYASNKKCEVQLFSGSTAKSDVTRFTSTSKQILTLDSSSWTRAELQNAKLVVTLGYYGGLVNGVDFEVTYSVSGGGTTYYTYTIYSVTENHEILINVGSTGTNLRIKMNGTWKKVLKIYVKEGTSWVEKDESELQTLSNRMLIRK